MNTVITPRRFSGHIRVPASKSHTIRQLLIASMAEGESRIRRPLESLDARSCAEVCGALGARIQETRGSAAADTAAGSLAGNAAAGNIAADTGPDKSGRLLEYRVTGTGGRLKKTSGALDVGNSGTTLFLALALAGLGNSPYTFSGDEQIRRRSAAPLLAALSDFGVHIESSAGCAPVTVCGPWRGGSASIECPTSQYLTALLLAAPLAPPGTVTGIAVPLLYEKPYIEMTLSYLRRQSIKFELAEDFSRFSIEGGQRYTGFDSEVPADFSSAAFPALAAAVSGGSVTLHGLDRHDTQGDKAFFDMLEVMGADVRWEAGAVTVTGGRPLKGGRFDLNATPDMLPAACVLASRARGETALVNVENARIKETDRIAVMAVELAKLGVRCRELADGIIIEGAAGASAPRAPQAAAVQAAACGLVLDGHGDHRVVMALACAALAAPEPCLILGSEAADVTYPGFLDLLTAGSPPAHRR